MLDSKEWPQDRYGSHKHISGPLDQTMRSRLSLASGERITSKRSLVEPLVQRCTKKGYYEREWRQCRTKYKIYRKNIDRQKSQCTRRKTSKYYKELDTEHLWTPASICTSSFTGHTEATNNSSSATGNPQGTRTSGRRN